MSIQAMTTGSSFERNIYVDGSMQFDTKHKVLENIRQNMQQASHDAINGKGKTFVEELIANSGKSTLVEQYQEVVQTESASNNAYIQNNSQVNNYKADRLELSQEALVLSGSYGRTNTEPIASQNTEFNTQMHNENYSGMHLAQAVSSVNIYV